MKYDGTAHIHFLLQTLTSCIDGWFGWFMVFNATFNNIAAISSRSALENDHLS
jgi:hypothetical protein